MKKVNMRYFLLLSLVFSVVSSTLVNVFDANAISPANWNAGRIIDDVDMTNKDSMTVGQIQNFLNSKVAVCDTNGQQLSEFGGPDINGDGKVQRWEWGQSRYNQTTFPCLKDYTENGLSAAQIIYNSAQTYTINPQVLIVLLQKEQGLVADTWPLNIQYRSATGYGCPDTAPCDSQYYGLTNQLKWSATMFRAIQNNSPTWYTPYVLGSNYIQWSPNSSCGGSTVNIQNRATQALYNYTPYQPNQAALNAGYGMGDGCSAYGNRNFWLYFNDWFPSYESIFKAVQVSNLSISDNTPARGQAITYSFTFTNTLSTAVTLDAVGAVGRIGSLTGANGDLGWQGPITLQPGASQQFTFSSIIRDTKQFYVWPAIFFKGTYLQYNNWGSSLSVHEPNFTLSQPLTASPATIYAGQDVTLSATIKNNEDQPINYDAVGIPVRFYDRYNYDTIWAGPGVVAAGAEIPLSAVRNIDKPGPFTYWVSSYFSGRYSTLGPVQKFNSLEVKPNFSVSGPTLSTTSPVEGGALGASFSVTNNLPVPINASAVGVVGRFGSTSGPNRDIGWQGPVQFAAGETKTFTGLSRIITEVGKHNYWIGILHDSTYIQYSSQLSTVTSLAPSFSVGGVSFNTTSPVQGDSLQATVTITNNLSVPVDVESLGVVGRFGSTSGPNRDIGWQGPVHFNANETKVISGFSRTITEVGPHYYWVGVFNNNKYLQYYNQGSTIVSTAP
jgi:hypothetical protein